MRQYPYEITYKLPNNPNRRYKKRVEASYMAEAKQLFESSNPSAIVILAVPLPANR